MRLLIHDPEGIPSHTVELLFSREWLHAQFPDMDEQLKFLENCLEQVAPTEVTGLKYRLHDIYSQVIAPCRSVGTAEKNSKDIPRRQVDPGAGSRQYAVPA
jgi:hypothetical protein